MWRHWITDARTGHIIAPIDIPHFQWQNSGREQSFTTTSRDLGDRSANNLTLPWSAIPADTPLERSRLLDSSRRAICITWADTDRGDDIGTPIIWGLISERQDRQSDTSFSLASPMDLLAERIAVREGSFRDGRSTDTIGFAGLSYRAIMSEIGLLCTQWKQGGALPIDWPYYGEKGTRQKTSLHAWNVQNNQGNKLLTDIANLINGPDFTFEPYLVDQNVRVQFLAGSDADIRIYPTAQPIELAYYPGAGQLDDLQVSHATPIHRWYASGAGTDDSTVTAIAEDLMAVNASMDPQVLREGTFSDTDIDNVDVLKRHVQSRLAGNKSQLIQISASISLTDKAAGGLTCSPALLRPGMPVILHIEGFPSLPDADYQGSIMLLSGDQTSKAKITFDVMVDPIQ